MIQLKRVYEKPSRNDGLRILVDRLWPRGLSKERAAVSLWLKDVAPSTELRKWFGHDPARWNEFQTRYWKELRGKKEALELIEQKSKEHTVTLVYAARDEKQNEALVLKRFSKAAPTSSSRIDCTPMRNSVVPKVIRACVRRPAGLCASSRSSPGAAPIISAIPSGKTKSIRVDATKDSDTCACRRFGPRGRRKGVVERCRGDVVRIVADRLHGHADDDLENVRA